MHARIEWTVRVVAASASSAVRARSPGVHGNAVYAYLQPAVTTRRAGLTGSFRRTFRHGSGFSEFTRDARTCGHANSWARVSGRWISFLTRSSPEDRP
jgi:hypothetical protein